MKTKPTDEFNLLVTFATCTAFQCEIIKRDQRKLPNEKLRRALNNLTASVKIFKDAVHKNLGPEFSALEVDLNSHLYGLMRQIHSMDGKGVEMYFEHMDEWNDKVEKMKQDAD